MKKSVKSVSVIALSIIILVAWFLIKQINRIHAPAFVLFNGYDGQLYLICLKLLMALSIAGIVVIGAISAKKWKKVVTGISVLLGLVLFLFIGYQGKKLVEGWNSFAREPYLVSPDGMHALYQDGGDCDIFGFSSGYMHYAMECDKNGYARVFYCFNEECSPKIEWYEDGFLVSYYCQECTQDHGAQRIICPESDYRQTFRYEKQEDGIFFYYEPIQ